MPSVDQRELQFDALSYTGVQDANDPTASQKRKAQNLRNCYPELPETGRGVVGRPGFDQLGAGGTYPLNSGAEVQWVGTHTQKNGTELTLTICGGKLYQYNWGTDAWTEKTLVGVALPATGRVYVVSFFDDIIVQPNDGTNKPFKWDGTTFTSLTAAPLAFGRPWIHYGKVFFIAWATRTDIVWSDEADATSGYTGAQAWSVYQTSTDPLEAGFGINEALYLWRERSITVIYGQVTSNFSSTGTREGVSSTVGTLSPDSIYAGPGEEVYFVDRENKPWVILKGGVLEPMWNESLTRTEGLAFGTAQTKVSAQYYAPADLMLFAVAASGETYPNQILTYRENTREYSGYWDGWNLTCLGRVIDSSGEAFIVMGSSDGYIYRFGNPTGSLWTDALGAGTAAITHVLTGGAMGYDTYSSKEWDRVHFNLGAAMSGASFALEVPTGTGSAQTIPTVTARDEYKVSLGLGDFGRWARPIITHATSGEQFRFLALSIVAYLDTDNPELT
jgi:hypothetical protein